MFRAIISLILRNTRLCLQMCYKAPTMLPAGDKDGHQQAASSVLYTTSCKHNLVLLRMVEIIARNMLSWLKLLIKLLLLHLVGCLYNCISDAGHANIKEEVNSFGNLRHINKDVKEKVISVNKSRKGAIFLIQYS